MFKKINDLLALLLDVIIIPTFWIMDGLGIVNMNGEVMGATIAVWTLIAQFYFRKAPVASDTTTSIVTTSTETAPDAVK